MIDLGLIYNKMGPELRSQLVGANTPAMRHLLMTAEASIREEMLELTVPQPLTTESAIRFVLQYRAARDDRRIVTELRELFERAMREYAQQP